MNKRTIDGPFKWQRASKARLLCASILISLGTFAILSPGLQAATNTANTAITVSQSPPTLCWGEKISNPKVAILCIHGLGLHKGCFDEFGKVMASKGIPAYAIDVRGFGDWYLKGDEKLDLTQTLADIHATLQNIRAKYPNTPIYILGESMGGAIALHAAAAYPDLISGLISSVPSGDRWSGVGQDLKIGLHVLAGGFNGRFNVGKHVVEHATHDEQLRKRWEDDPASRSKFSPEELILFQNFMNKNNVAAEKLTSMPALILQGAFDKLVRPGGSFNVWDHLATPDKTFVASKSTEHLIFEYGSFSKDDLNYVCAWIDKHLAPPPDQHVSSENAALPPKPSVPSKDEILASSPNLTNKHGSSTPSDVLTSVQGNANLPSLSYWIELMRDGKRYRCNNKTSFKSGDEIRIHVISNSDGFAYILMKQGSSGAHAILFPEVRTGRNNAVQANKDYALPSATWLKFDNHSGTERVGLVFSKSALDPDTNKYLNNKQTVLVSADRSGAKDLCPTRMQMSWDDPNPLIMPSSSTESDSALASMNSSMVKIAQKDNKESVIAVDFELEHQP